MALLSLSLLESVGFPENAGMIGTENALEWTFCPYPHLWHDWLQVYSADISAGIAEGATNSVVPSAMVVCMCLMSN